jgi:hypothetical protein
MGRFPMKYRANAAKRQTGTSLLDLRQFAAARARPGRHASTIRSGSPKSGDFQAFTQRHTTCSSLERRLTMQSHWNAFLLWIGAALGAFIIAMMYGLYGVGIGVMVVTLFVGAVYAIGVGDFHNRPDPPDERRATHPLSHSR